MMSAIKTPLDTLRSRVNSLGDIANVGTSNAKTRDNVIVLAE